MGIFACACIDAIAAMLAASRINCAYVPLDPDFAEARLIHMIQDSSSVVVLFDSPCESLTIKIREQTTARFVSLQSPVSIAAILPP